MTELATTPCQVTDGLQLPVRRKVQQDAGGMPGVSKVGSQLR